MVDGSGRELARTAGLQSAAELARFYKAAAAKAQPPVNSNAHVGSDDDASARAEDNDNQRNTRPEASRNNNDDRPQDDRDQAEPVGTNPKPWETVVRIRVLSKRSTGFGSGTVIYSTPDESRSS